MNLLQLFIALSIIAMFLTPTSGKLLNMTQEIGEAIFQQGKYYIIYVCPEPSPRVLQPLKRYCVGGLNCVILHSGITEYKSVNQFVGMYVDEYLLILDTKEQKKYTLPIVNSEIEVGDILNFQNDYHTGNLEEYFGSEPIPLRQIHPTCEKLVGATVDNFLNTYTPIKIIYLYANDELCDKCPEYLKEFIEQSRLLADQDLVIFGYFDVFKNTHEQIQYYDVPEYLIFGPFEYDPIKVTHKTVFEQLKSMIEKVIQQEEMQIEGPEDEEQL